MQFRNSAAVVTGGASGLGEATVRALAAQGVRVAIFDVNAERGNAVARDVGGVFCPVDVTSDESVDAGFAAARAFDNGCEFGARVVEQNDFCAGCRSHHMQEMVRFGAIERDAAGGDGFGGEEAVGHAWSCRLSAVSCQPEKAVRYRLLAIGQTIKCGTVSLNP